MNHLRFTRKSIELSNQALRNGNHPFGALLVLEQKVIVTAENTVMTELDWTRHAELNLVKLAKRGLDRETISHCTLYASTEPCPMCAGAIYKIGISRLVFACSAALLRNITGGGSVEPGCRTIFAALGGSIEVTGPILEEEAAAVHRDCWQRGNR